MATTIKTFPFDPAEHLGHDVHVPEPCLWNQLPDKLDGGAGEIVVRRNPLRVQVVLPWDGRLGTG